MPLIHVLLKSLIASFFTASWASLITCEVIVAESWEESSVCYCRSKYLWVQIFMTLAWCCEKHENLYLAKIFCYMVCTDAQWHTSLMKS